MPGRRAEAVLLGPVAEPVDPELAGHLEEERVARVAEAAVDVARTEAAVVPVVEPGRRRGSGSPRSGTSVVAVILPSASAPVPVTSLYVEPGGKCAWIAWLSSGLFGFLSSAWKSFVADPAREQVVVVRRQADHREDLAGLRVHHDARRRA